MPPRRLRPFPSPSLALLLLLLSLAVSFFVVPVSAESDPTTPPSDVVTLTDANFDSLTATGSWLVEFYAPWCGHCKSLAPTWEKAATQLKPVISLGKVDCTQDGSLAKRFGVKGYPTLKFLREGQHKTYSGGRTLADITKFVKTMTAPPVTEIDKETDIASFVLTQPAVFVLVGTGSDEQHTVFDKIAYSLQGTAAFIHLPSPSESFLSQHHVSASSLPTVVYLSKGLEAESFPVSKRFTHAALVPWIESRRIPLISTLSPDNFEDITSTNNNKLLALIVSNSSTQQVDAWYPLTKQYRDRVVCATVDATKYSKWIGQFIDASSSALPVLLMFDNYPDYVYKPEKQPQSMTEMHNMFKEVVTGKRSSVASIPWYYPQKYVNVSQHTRTHRNLQP